MCSPAAAARTHLASEHERQRPVAADDLTLAHDRRETLKILDGQRHQSGDARQTDRRHKSAARRPVGALIQRRVAAGSRGEVAGNQAVVAVALPRSWFRCFQPRLKRRRDATQTHSGTPRVIQN